MQVSEKGKLRLFWICGILRVFDGFLRFFAGFLRVNLDVFLVPNGFCICCGDFQGNFG